MAAQPKPVPQHPVIDIDSKGTAKAGARINNGEHVHFQVDFTGHPDQVCLITTKAEFMSANDQRPDPPPGGVIIHGK